YKMQGDGPSDEEEKEMPLASNLSLQESLIVQLGFLRMSERETLIGRQIIGSLDDDGYLRREPSAISNDLAFAHNIDTDTEEIEAVLFKVQEFDPPGIAARDLRECLLLQLKRRDHHFEEVVIATQIIETCFEEFTKKHYEKIEKKLNINEEQLKVAMKVITRLTPRPGAGESGEINSQYLVPDFLLTNNSGKLELTLNSKNAPELRISNSYQEMFKAYEKSKDKKSMKDTVTFVKQKLDSARWFIDAIKQRQDTLLRTMQAIIAFQYEFFLEGDESNLKPMILKDIADKIGMDISTVSRISNSKSIQTEFGIYPLKYFFSEGITLDSGEDVSSREVKSILKELIDKEDKTHPLADEKLEELLIQKGYNIARRTVAKYREQLNIPVARMRKEIG
ncbi:MAG: RNA polymerase factor sigma-54, partial [Cytophagales bacterium]|nr:RNA polymerase factor sigma-54 [Cytophagales bacterium]